MTPPRPSELTALRRLRDVAAVTTWAVGLAERRPFTVRATAERLVVSISARSPRQSRCQLPAAHLSVGFPSGWYAELTPPGTCAFFGPRPFAVVPQSDARTWTVAITTTEVSAARVVATTLRDGGVYRRSARVAGYRATVLDVVVPRGAPFLPAGDRYRLYVVAAQPRTVLIQGVPLSPGPAVQRATDAADQIAARTRRP